MNILIDCITLLRKNGAAEYQRRVITELLKRGHQEGLQLFGLYDSSVGIAYEDMQPRELCSKGMTMIDVNGTTVASVISSYHIDKFYIGCVQILAEYKDIGNVTCEVICVVHDLSFEEKEREDLDIYLRAQNKPKYKLIYWLICRLKHDRGNCYILSIVKLTFSNPKVRLIAVSEYTKYSLIYTYGIPEDRITVLFSPERIYSETSEKVSDAVKQFVKDDKPFFLILGTQHHLKNTRKAVHAFKHFSLYHPEYRLLTAGREIEQVCKQHTPMGFLSDADLHLLYQSCHALIYPTLFEGFGYPPIEAMRYGKPVLVSNIGPVREVLDDAPIYFSPLYETDIFQALNTLHNTSYDRISQQSKLHYEELARRQNEDLLKLLNLILKS